MPICINEDRVAESQFFTVKVTLSFQLFPGLRSVILHHKMFTFCFEKKKEEIKTKGAFDLVELVGQTGQLVNGMQHYERLVREILQNAHSENGLHHLKVIQMTSI